MDQIDKAKRDENVRRHHRQQRLDYACLRGRYRDATFETFEAATAQQRAVLDACRSFVESFDQNQGEGLLLLGPPGTGKTHLGAAIIQALAEIPVPSLTREPHALARRVGRMVTAREIVRELRSTWSKDAEESEADVIERLANRSLLVLDEVGVGFGSEAEQVQLFDVLDMRYQLRHPTVLLSNLNLPLLKGVIGDRALDRLCEGAQVLVCDWPSYRTSNR